MAGRRQPTRLHAHVQDSRSLHTDVCETIVAETTEVIGFGAMGITGARVFVLFGDIDGSMFSAMLLSQTLGDDCFVYTGIRDSRGYT